jgi:hypothetical protein
MDVLEVLGCFNNEEMCRYYSGSDLYISEIV